MAARLAVALAVACVVAIPVAVLAVLAQRPDWPVARLDHAVADGLNSFAQGRGWWVHAMEAVSAVGHPTTFRVGATILALWLFVAGRHRLALWALVTTWGAALLGVLLKTVVGRARPVVPVPVSTEPGYSFPSGHSLAAVVGCGIVLLLVLALADSLPRSRRVLTWTLAIGVAALVGFSRVALGVHFLSDVAGAWLVGAGWVAATALAFEAWRVRAGLPVTDPVAEGLQPEVRAQPDAAVPPWWGSGIEIGRHLKRVVLPWLALLAVVVGVGLLISHVLDHGPVGNADRAIARWFADHRTPTGNGLSRVGSLLGETGQVVVLTVGYYLTGRVVNRSWHQSTALMFAVVGEVVGFVLISLLVDRPRPPVPHLDAAPPTDSFPSGHVAATTCCYGMFAVLLYRRWALTRGPSRRVAWLFGAGAGLIVVAVAVSRLYRGMHHLTDVLGGMLFGGAWLLIVVILVLRPMCPPEYQLPRWL